MPIRYRDGPAITVSTSAAIWSLVALLADVQLQLPAIGIIARDTPEFQRADFGDTRFQSDRQHASLLAFEVERHFQRAEFLDVGGPVLQEIADVVLLADGGTQEAELSGLADNQAEFAAGHERFAASFHAEGHDTKRLERGFHSGDSGHRAFDSHVIGTRGAAANANTLSAAGASVIS